MKKMTKNVSKVLYNILLISISILCINMTPGNDTCTSKEPEYVELKDGQPSFLARIYDDKSSIELKDFSFTGHTELGGVRKEDDDSVNTLDLSEIKELQVKNPNYISEKYKDKEYILASAVTNNGVAIKNLLIPRQVTICGIEVKTKMKKVWLLRNINKITLSRPVVKKKKIIDPSKEKGFISSIGTSIKDGFNWITEKLNP